MSLPGKVCGRPTAKPSGRGGCFSLEEMLVTIKFYLQVQGMMHPILNHCFYSEGLYYPEHMCVCAQMSKYTLFLSVIRALTLKGWRLRVQSEVARSECLSVCMGDSGGNLNCRLRSMQ